MEKTDKIAILGYGVEGRAMCEYLLRHGHTDVTVCDQSERVDGLPEHVKFRGGSTYLQELSDFDVVFRSPGISYFKPEIAALVDDLDSQTLVTSMTKYFFEHCRCPIIGVTGTKGKGTTSSLTADILQRGGHRVFLGGNIGVPAVSFLDELSEDALVVLELSSFQLVDLETSPHIAVVLNVTSEHLDYHASVEEYHESKYPIMQYQTEADFAVLNADYPYAKEFSELGSSQRVYISTRQHGSGAFWVDNGRICYVDESDPDPRERGMREIIACKDIALLGRHNLENVLPAVAVARIFDVSLHVIEISLRKFQGLPHRLEPVGEMIVAGDVMKGDGNSAVTFYNDSFSTTPESCLAACSTFNDLEKPFYLIAGGSEKGSDFTALGWKLSQMKYLQKVFLMGPSGVRIGEALTSGHASCVEDGSVCRLPVAVVAVNSLREAVEKAFGEARNLGTDTVILMSPAAASFNEFKNYKERGETFKELAKEMRADAV